MSYSVFIEFIQENSKYICDFDQLKIKSQKLSISHLWCPVFIIIICFLVKRTFINNFGFWLYLSMT